MALQPEVRVRLTPILPEWAPQPLLHCALYFGPSRLTPKVQVFLDLVGEFFGTERDPRLGVLQAERVFGRATEKDLNAKHWAPDLTHRGVRIASSAGRPIPAQP